MSTSIVSIYDNGMFGANRMIDADRMSRARHRSINNGANIQNMRNATTPLLVLIAALLSPRARAATVTTTADDGPGSLRQAIANAAQGETINFAAVNVITLTSGALSIDKDLIISGPGASNLLIQRS